MAISESGDQQEKFKKGDLIGQKYEVYDLLGEGGFGIVYLVYSKWDKAVYALKTIREEYLCDINVRKRFIKEMQAWINLDKNPFIVRAHYIDEIASRHFIRLEYIAPDKTGLNTLEGYLRKRPPDLNQSLLWSIQFCYGMEHAYSKNMLAHRDIKPSNILITNDGTLKITDFGLAGVYQQISDAKFSMPSNAAMLQTVIGSSIGTPEYMSPEQFSDFSACDERSDIYSFGIVLYQIASGGKLPFCSDNPVHRWSTLKYLHCEKIAPKLDSPLFTIIQRCIMKNPKERYQSFMRLRIDIEALFRHNAKMRFSFPSSSALDASDCNNKGNSLETIGKYEEALECYNRAIELNPLYAEAWQGKGFILGERLSRPQEAMSCYEKACEIRPDRASSWNDKGMGYSGLSKHQEAIECYDRALEIDPRNTCALTNKATEFMHLYQWKDEIACYDKAIEIDPLCGRAWRSKGARLSLFHRYAEAIECFDHALTIDPTDVYAWRMKGSTLEKLKKYIEAANCYTHALTINPLADEIWYYKGRLMDDIGNTQEALKCYSQLIEIDPKDSMGWELKIELLIKIGQYEDAIYCFEQSIIKEPQPEDIWFSIGHSFMEVGISHAAIVAFKNFIRHATGSNTNMIDEIEEIIKELECTE